MGKDIESTGANSDVRVTHHNNLWLLYRILSEEFFLKVEYVKKKDLNHKNDKINIKSGEKDD